MFLRHSALLVSLVAFPATASAQSVGILGIEATNDDAVANALTARLRVSAHDFGWHVSDREVLLSQAEIANGCSRTQPTCLDQIASMLEVSELVFGSINRVMTADPTQFELEVQLYRYSRLERSIIRHYTGRVAALPSEEALDGFADTAIAALALPNEAEHVAAVVPVDEDESSLILDPTAEILAPPLASGGVDLEYVGWPLIGLAAASFATALGLAIVIDSYNNDSDYVGYRSSIPPGTGVDACASAASGMLYEPSSPEAIARLDRSRSICADGPTLEVAQIILYVVSGLSAAAGGVLIGYDLSLSPSVSADHAYLGINGTF